MANTLLVYLCRTNWTSPKAPRPKEEINQKPEKKIKRTTNQLF